MELRNHKGGWPDVTDRQDFGREETVPDGLLRVPVD